MENLQLQISTPGLQFRFVDNTSTLNQEVSCTIPGGMTETSGISGQGWEESKAWQRSAIMSFNCDSSLTARTVAFFHYTSYCKLCPATPLLWQSHLKVGHKWIQVLPGVSGNKYIVMLVPSRSFRVSSQISVVDLCIPGLKDFYFWNHSQGNLTMVNRKEVPPAVDFPRTFRNWPGMESVQHPCF